MNHIYHRVRIDTRWGGPRPVFDSPVVPGLVPKRAVLVERIHPSSMCAQQSCVGQPAVMSNQVWSNACVLSSRVRLCVFSSHACSAIVFVLHRRLANLAHVQHPSSMRAQQSCVGRPAVVSNHVCKNACVLRSRDCLA